METITFSKISTEDLAVGTGHFETRLQDGRVVTLTEVDVSRMLAEIYGATYNTLPTPQLAGRLARLSDKDRGLWMDTGAQWASLSGDVINVKLVGARGNDSADDTAAFEEAIALLPNGGTILVPPGIYRVDPLSVSQLRSIRFQGVIAHGAGQESGQLDDEPCGRSVLRATGTQTHVLSLSGFYHQVRDLVLDGALTTTNVLKFVTSPTTQCVASRCHVLRALPTTGNLVLMDGGSGQVDMCRLERCVLIQRPGAPGTDQANACVSVQGSNTFLNRIYECTLQGATYGVDVNQGGADVEGNDFQYLTTACVRTVVPQCMRVSRNYVETPVTYFVQDATSAAVNVASPLVVEHNQLNVATGMTFTQRQQVILTNNRIANGNVTVTGAGQHPLLASGNVFATASTGFTGAGLTAPGVDEVGNVYLVGSTYTPFTITRSTWRHNGLTQFNTGATASASTGDLYLGATTSVRWALGGDAAQALRFRPSSFSLANGATANLTYDSGFLFVITDAPSYALFILRGGANATYELLDPGTLFSVSAGTGSSINIYWDSDHYELENNSGATRLLTLLHLGTQA